MADTPMTPESGQELSPQWSGKLSFRLPDATTSVWISSDKDAGLQYTVGSETMTLAQWTAYGTQTRVSAAMVSDDRAEVGFVLHLELLDKNVNSASPFRPSTSNHELVQAWAAVYALWLHPDHRDCDLIPISLSSSRLGEYMTRTGLAVVSPFSPNISAGGDRSDIIYWLHRSAFWQGAGAPDAQQWLQDRPEVTGFPGFNSTLGVFATQMGFTRKGNVCTVHPVRPPKPKPGSVIYSRYVVELGQQLQIIHIDASNPVHFETYKNWQNSDRVNAAWKERGPDEHHRAYLAAQLADPHTMSCIFTWDGELAGYTELGYAKEDNAACFSGSCCGVTIGDYDQNSHIIQGEERFRGGARYQAVATSIKHCCFLRDPRTEQILAEPRHDLAHVHIQSKYLPQDRKKRFELPHKTAILFALQRNRFFQEGHFV
ncbi:siderophore biosynthesis [Cordyceps javanica]|uniref:Siderophore biosynthesis n=1 Tax=Cordyceps javanica TaxID=43265 RepID=A0A545UXE6_9HYPO|nr:siderophore biosynthesis [Cordyceps javanica]TQW06020.1 acetyltransferase [Cordyceps javanica]